MQRHNNEDERNSAKMKMGDTKDAGESDIDGAPLKEGSQWTSRESQETIGELKPTGGNREIVSFRVMYLSKASR